MFSGYLTLKATTYSEDGLRCQLCIPNREVLGIFVDVFKGWIEQAGSSLGEDMIGTLSAAMCSGDAAGVEHMLGSLLLTGMSMFDFGQRPVEAIYQAFIVGLLLHLEKTHRVRSNRESGFGRADVLVMPRQAGPGVVLELKTIDHLRGETAEMALDRAATQVTDRRYATEVLAAGATEVYQYAVAFDGKRCWVKAIGG